MGNTKYQSKDSAVVADVDGQLVALDINEGVCYGLDHLATRIWGLLDQPRSVLEIRDILIEEYEVDRDQCAVDVKALLEDLKAAGLVH